MLTWPSREQVDRELRRWAATLAPHHPDLLRLGYFGSYARGDWGVGSDLDIVAVVASADQPFYRRAVAWDLTSLPVPAEMLIYTQPEWERLQREGGRLALTLMRETIWILPFPPRRSAGQAG